MLKLRTTYITPQGGWRYPRWPDKPITDPNRDLIYGGDLPDLKKRVVEFRVANGMDIGGLDAAIEDWLCRNSQADCVSATPRKFGVLARANDVLRFMYAMSIWMSRGGHVEQEEAERRGEICASCDRNQELESPGCLGCFGLAARTVTLIGNRTTRVDSSLKFCNVCGCSCAIQAFVPMDVLARVHRPEDFPAHCWKRQWVDAQKQSS